MFCDAKTKTVRLTFLILGVPLGVILGYIITAFLAQTLNVSDKVFDSFSGDGPFISILSH